MVAICSLPHVVLAATGQRISLPQPPNKPKHFLTATIDTRWLEGTGYRPVTVTLNSLRGVLTKDRTIRVQMTVRGNWQHKYMPVVSETITIPEGSTSITKRILIPQEDGFGYTSVRFYERGSELKEMRFDQWFGNSSNYAWSEAAPAVLVIDSTAPPNGVRPTMGVGMVGPVPGLRASTLEQFEVPDVRLLARTIGMYNQTLTRDDPTKREMLDHLNQLPRLEVLPPDELPDTWLAFSCCNVIIVGIDDLLAMRDATPDKVAALREWAATGNTLCVHGIGKDFDRLDDCERVLDLREIRGTPRNGWRDPATGDFATFFDYDLTQNNGAYVTVNGTQQWLYGTDLLEHRKREAAKGRKETPAEIARKRRAAQFIYRDIGLGNVVALSTDKPFPGTNRQWGWIFRTLDRTNYKWYQRFGMSLHRDNPDFWNWLIPGVGLPPVVSFLVLISIFVIAIGPFNYFFLRRTRRLYLLLVTVPAGALLVTFSLLTYAMFMDGFGTKSRIRSVTSIDQPSNVAVTWSRQTYYSSLAPSRGLVYPKHAAVYPLLALPAEGQNQISPTRRINWDENQVLRRGYMRSRTPAQFMVVGARPCLAELMVTEGNPLEVKNQLETDISMLVLRDSGGNYWVGDDIKNEAEAKLRPVKQSELKGLNAKLARIHNESRPSNPKGFRRHEYMSSYMYRSRRAYSYIDQQENAPRYGTSILERQLSTANGQLNKLQPRSYLALVSMSPEVPLGIPRTKEFSSFQVIIGKW